MSITILFCIISLSVGGFLYDVKIEKGLSPYRKIRHISVRVLCLFLSFIVIANFYGLILNLRGSLWWLVILFAVFCEVSVYHIKKLNTMKEIAKEMLEKGMKLENIIISIKLKKQELDEVLLSIKSDTMQE
ncbi:hypothetical protein [Candidatus Uabimicrobium sp. HlEnr_7]|uniref:hypothetical protein n=1 Tax=Candidatus Uabimicrobium helgolandensis TaxID=3095367 RepID=UPI0035567825